MKQSKLPPSDLSFSKHELETILYSLEGYIQGNDDDKLCDELEDICNKIVEELDPPKVTITPQQLEGDISTVTDSDYADKVDTLVDKMGMTKYKFDESFYNELVTDYNYRFPKFMSIDYPTNLQ